MQTILTLTIEYKNLLFILNFFIKSYSPNMYKIYSFQDIFKMLKDCYEF